MGKYLQEDRWSVGVLRVAQPSRRTRLRAGLWWLWIIGAYVFALVCLWIGLGR